MKKALILGITGQDGSYLAKLLLEKGYAVYGGSRDKETANLSNLNILNIANSIEMHSVNLNDFRSVFQLLNNIKPDEIYNLSGQSSVGLSFEQPLETFHSIALANLNLLETLRTINYSTKLYNAGSSECFGNTETPANEQTAFRPRSPYAAAKAAAFWQVANYREAYDLFATSGILFNHESILRPQRFVTKKIISTAIRISQGSNEKLVLGNLQIKRDWGWSPEYVVAMWKILQQDRPDDFVIATGKTHSLEEFVKYTFEKLNLNYKDFVVSDPSFFRPTDILNSYADTSYAEKILNWKAEHNMYDVIDRMLEETF